jgi:hypothetical protein
MRGFARAGEAVAAERGSLSVGRLRESENAPLADRWRPNFGFPMRIAES